MTQVAIASSLRMSWGVEVAELIRVVLMMPEQMTKARSFVRNRVDADREGRVAVASGGEEVVARAKPVQEQVADDGDPDSHSTRR